MYSFRTALQLYRNPVLVRKLLSPRTLNKNSHHHPSTPNTESYPDPPAPLNPNLIRKPIFKVQLSPVQRPKVPAERSGQAIPLTPPMPARAPGRRRGQSPGQAPAARPAAHPAQRRHQRAPPARDPGRSRAFLLPPRPRRPLGLLSPFPRPEPEGSRGAAAGWTAAGARQPARPA